MSDDTIIGPAVICPSGCELPRGMIVTPVPTPRHAWSDVIVCPNEGCGRAWIVVQRPEEYRPVSVDLSGLRGKSDAGRS